MSPIREYKPINMDQVDAEAACALAGTIVEINEPDRSARVRLRNGDEIEHVHFHYTCECTDVKEGDPKDGWAAFQGETRIIDEDGSELVTEHGDEVIMLWSPSDRSPGADNLTIIGFRDGAPRTCFNCATEKEADGWPHAKNGTTKTVEIVGGCGPYRWDKYVSPGQAGSVIHPNGVRIANEVTDEGERANEVEVEAFGLATWPRGFSIIATDRYLRETSCWIFVDCPEIGADSIVAPDEIEYFANDVDIRSRRGWQYLWEIVAGAAGLIGKQDYTIHMGASIWLQGAPVEVICGEGFDGDSFTVAIKCREVHPDGEEEWVTIATKTITYPGRPDPEASIEYETATPACGSSQVLSASGEGSGYFWKIEGGSGGAELSGMTGKSVTLSAPSSNANCEENCTVQMGWCLGTDRAEIIDEVAFNFDCSTPDAGIVYSTLTQACGGGQTLSSSDGQSYGWRIASGGGTLSAATGSSVTLTAPATNPNCASNCTVEMVRCPGTEWETVLDSVNIAFNQYTAADTAFITCSGAPVFNCYLSGWKCNFQYTYGWYGCDGTPLGTTYYACKLNLYGDACWGADAADYWGSSAVYLTACNGGVGNCGNTAGCHPDYYNRSECSGACFPRDQRQPAMIAGGCCPGPLW